MGDTNNISRVRLTKDAIEAAADPAEGKTQRFIRDDLDLCLGVRITANGTKSFIWEGRIDGVMCHTTLGRFPLMSVNAARKAAQRMRGDIANGVNPVADKKAERVAKAAEATFADLEREYFASHAIPSQKATRSIQEDRRNLALHVPAEWRKRRLSTFTGPEMARLHRVIGERPARTAANRTLALLRHMLNKAIRWGMLTGANPAAGIEMFKERKRERSFTSEELQQFGEALGLEPLVWRTYFGLTLLWGTRKNELLGARWEHVDFIAGTLAIPRTKGGRPAILPLFGPTLSLLDQLPSRGQSPWLFPSARPGVGRSGHLEGAQRVWERVRERAGITGPDVCIHTLRHTAGSWMAARGSSAAIVMRALNQSQLGTVQRYMHLDDNPVRAALEASTADMPSLAGPAVQPELPAVVSHEPTA